MIDSIPVLAVVLPLLGGFATPLFNLLGEKFNNSKIRDIFVFSIVVLTFLFVVLTAKEALGGEILVYKLAGRIPPWGINLAVDGLSALAGLAVAGVSILVVIYSFSFMDRESGLGKYYTLILFLIAGMLGIIFTGDIFNLYVFFEIMSISSYALVAFFRSGEALEGAFKYLVIGTLGTASILLGIAMAYSLVGTLNIADLAVRLNALMSTSEGIPISIAVTFGLFVTGFGVKIAMAPLHAWLPDAYQSAPSPISAIMAGGTAVTGVYALLRVSYFLFGGAGIETIFLILGLISMIIGALLALVQSDLKRMLAYSSISQMGYILVGLGLGTSLGIQGGLFHMLNNAIYKPLLFLCAGAVIYRVGTSNMDKLGGLGDKMPFTTGAFIIGALAISGVPPFNGFASKLTIYAAGVESGHYIATIIAVIISVLTLAYLFKAINSVFLGPTPDRFEKVEEVSPVMLIPILILAGMCIVLAVLPQLGLNIAEKGQTALIERAEYIKAVLGGSI